MKTNDAIKLLEKITNKKVVLKESVFTDFLSKKQPKAVREALEKFVEFEGMQNIPKQVWNKAMTGIEKINPNFSKIIPSLPTGLLKLKKMEDELLRLQTKYKESTIFDISTKNLWTKTEEDNWQKVYQDSKEEYSIFNRAKMERRNTYGKTVEVPYQVWKKLDDAQLLPPTYFSIHNSEKYLNNAKEALKLVSGNKEAEELVKKTIAELSPLKTLMDAVKVLAPRVEDTKTQRQREKVESIKGGVNEQVYNAVKEIAEEFRLVIEAQRYKVYKMLRLEFQELSKEKNSTDLYVLVPKKNVEIKTKYGSRLTDENFEARHRWDNVLGPSGLMTDNEIKEKANTESHEEVAKFLAKMADKLGGIFKGVDINLEIIKLTNRSIVSNELMFKINGGESSFIILNKITQNYSNLGTFFYRYPTTFHNAQVKGVPVRMPDETSVKKALLQAYK